MSDEQHRDDEIEVEGHSSKAGAHDEPAGDAEADVEAHVYKTATVRMDSPSTI
jgi:hypothetical protein